MKRFHLLPALVVALAIPSVAGAQDDVGGVFDPTDGWELYRFESVPEGAAIEYRGEAKYFTDAQFEVDTTYLSTIRLLLDGYQPCHFAEGSAKKDKIGLMGSGIRFVCHMVRAREKEDDPSIRDASPTWVMEGGPELTRGPNFAPPG